jgi:Fic family protein
LSTPPYQLFTSPEQKAALEARNGLLQFEAIAPIVAASKSGFNFTPEILCELQRLAIQDIYTCAGKMRDGPVFLIRTPPDPSKHQPPPWEQVVPLVDEMCEHINCNFGRLSPIQLASYAMWRINWIHPFFGGNGRTSRTASYLLLSVRMGFNLPGLNTIPQQIEQDPLPYYGALESADESVKLGHVDLSQMESLLSQLLAAQLLSIHDKATDTKLSGTATQA